MQFLQSSVFISPRRFRPLFLFWLSVFRSFFPKILGMLLDFDFEMSFQDWRSFFSIRRFGNLFPSVPSSPAGMNYI